MKIFRAFALLLLLIPLGLSAQVRWTTRNPSPTTVPLKALAAGNGVYVAVAEHGTVVTSTDGASWQVETFPSIENLNNVAFANGHFFARGDSGTIFVSDDGHYWLQRYGGGVSTGFGPVGHNVVYGNGRYVAVSYEQAVVSSSDTVTWTRQPAPLCDQIAFGSGVFVLTSRHSNNFNISSDGLTWTQIFPAPFPSVQGLAYGGGHFVVLSNQQLYQSTDALTWTAIPNLTATDVAFVQDRFIATSTSSSSTITSPDGVTWTTHSGPELVIPSSQIASLGEGFVGFAGLRVYRSDNASEWAPGGTHFSTTAFIPGLAFAHDRFLTGNGYVSDDGIAWSAGGFAVPATAAFNGVVKAAHDRFFLFSLGAVYTSVDGLVGAKAADLGFTARSIAYGNGHYIIVGETGDGTKGGTAVSDDGVNWTDRGVSADFSSLVDVQFGDGQFVAVARNGSIYTSPNGTMWTVRPHVATSNSASAIAYGAGRWVIAGDPSLTSTDGITWINGSTIPDATAVVFANGLFVLQPTVYGAKGQQLRPAGHVATSPDGLHWTFRDIGDFYPFGFAFGRGSWIASGAQGTIMQSFADDAAQAPVFASGMNSAFTVGDDTNIVLDAPASGSGPISYQWYRQGQPIAGANSSTYTIANWRDYYNNTDYAVSATNAHGSALLPYRVPFQSRQLRPDDSGLVFYAAPTADGCIVLKLGNSFVFSPGTLGPEPLSFEWFKDGIAIPNSDAESITIPYDAATDIDSIYSVALTNLWGRVNFDFSLTPKVVFAPTEMQANLGGSINLGVGLSTPISSGGVTLTWTKDGQLLSTKVVNANGSGASALRETYSLTGVKSSDYGVYRLTITNNFGTISTDYFTVGPPAVSRLVNLSVRAHIGTGDDVLIAGYVGSGSGAGPNILARGIGPTLATLGVAAPLAPAHLALNDSTGSLLASNEHWDAPPAADPDFLRGLMSLLGAFALPAGSADAALLRPGALNTTLPPRFTSILSGVGGSTGVGLVELYEYAPSAERLVNLSARARVGTGENVLIAGFVVTGHTPLKLLIRAVGPTLATQGIAAPLANPKLTLYDAHGHELHNNDQWNHARNLADLRAATTATGAFSLLEGSNDAAMLETLEPGVYSAHVTSVDGSPGIALVEIYEAP